MSFYPTTVRADISKLLAKADKLQSAVTCTCFLDDKIIGRQL